MALKKKKFFGNCDEFDFLILKELRENSKISIRLLANRTGMHPNTLIQRINKLEKDGIIIKYSADLDYSKLGYDLHAIVSIRVSGQAHKRWEMISELSVIPEILALYAVTGEFDAVAIIKTKNNESLTQTLKEISKRDYVIGTHTQLVLHAYKHSYEFNPFTMFGRM